MVQRQRDGQPRGADGRQHGEGVEADARTRLLAAAVAAFAAKGFHGTTTRDISTTAGMSPAALYVHHRSKEELLHQISLAGHERTLALVTRRPRRRPTRSSGSAA